MPPRPSGASTAKPANVPLSAAAQQQKANSVGIADLELPKTTLTKLAKGSIPDNVKMQQDVTLALLRSSTLFINYLASAAQDQAIARSGKNITASDVIKAITELDFGPADAVVPLLEQELAAYRAQIAAAKASKKSAGPGRGKGPRKSGATAQGDGDVEMDEGEGAEEDDEDEGEADGDERHGDGEVEEEGGGVGDDSELVEGDRDDEA